MMEKQSLRLFLPLIAGSLVLLLAPLTAGSLDWTAAGSLTACLLALGAAQLLAWWRQKATGEIPAVTWALLLFAAIQLLSLIASVNRDSTIKQIMLTVAAGSLALILGTRSGPASSGASPGSATGAIWRLLLPSAAVAASLAYVSVMGVREYAQNFRFDPATRIFSTFFNPDITAGFIGMALLVCLSVLWIDFAMAISLALGAAAVLGAAALALTGSKGGWLSFLAGLVVMGLVRRRTRLRGSGVGRWFMPILILCALAAASLSKMLLGRIAAASTGEAHSMLFRELVWKSALKMMLARPLTGYGAGTFSQAYARHAIAGPTMMAHSSFLQAGAENGALGLASLVVAVLVALSPLVRLLQRQPEDGMPPAELEVRQNLPLPAAPDLARALVPGLAGALVLSAAHNLIDFGWGVPGVWLVFWGLAGLLAAAARVLDYDVGENNGRAAEVGRAGVSRPSPGDRRIANGSRRKESPAARFLAAGAVVLLVMAAWSGFSAAAESYGSAARAASAGGGPGRSGVTPDLPQALDLAAAAIRLDPLNGSFFVLRADAEMALAAAGGPSPDPVLQAAATADLNRAARLMPASAAPLWLRGRFQEAAGQIAAAEQSYRAALGRDPHVLEADLRLAALAIQQNQPRIAREWFLAVTAVESSDYARVRGVPEDFDTHYLEAWAGLARVDSSLHQWSQAADDGEHALSDLESYAHEARLHFAYETLWTVYDLAHRQQLAALADSVVSQLETDLAAAGRSAEIPAIKARLAAFHRAIASIKEPVSS